MPRSLSALQNSVFCAICFVMDVGVVSGLVSSGPITEGMWS